MRVCLNGLSVGELQGGLAVERKLDELYSGVDCKGDVAVGVGRDCGATAVSGGAAHAETMHRTSPAHFAWIERTRAASEQIEHIE